jgi:hypothetical protein
MIKKFNNFSINELKSSTYLSAASKLKGGGHEKRGEDLDRWSKMHDTRDFGVFNLGFEIREFKVISRRNGKKTWERSNVPLSYLDKNLSVERKKDLEESRLIKSSPNSCHVSSCLIDEIEEMYGDDPTTLFSLGVTFAFSPDESNGMIYPFYLCLDLKWDEEDTFVVSDKAWIDETSNDFEGMFFFADRKSAVKFKNLLTEENIKRLSTSENFDSLRDFFVNNAKDSKQWSKFFNTLRSINTNLIYR